MNSPHRTDELGIIACETLYAELEQIAPDATVRYVPQEYHEFPVNVPREAESTEVIEKYVRELEDAGVDRIHILYDADDEVLSGIQSDQVPLFRSRAGDCVSMFLHGIEPLEFGERKASRTYYLTRGWIERGLDAHKLYRGFLGEREQLIVQFERAAAEPDGLSFTWPDTDGFERAVERGQGMSREAIGRFFHDVVGFYERVVLIDTGTCSEFHREYAESFRAFIAELSAEHGDGHEVTLSVVDGDTSVLESLVDPSGETDLLERHPADAPR